jgi:hypothetical protein
MTHVLDTSLIIRPAGRTASPTADLSTVDTPEATDPLVGGLPLRRARRPRARRRPVAPPARAVKRALQGTAPSDLPTTAHQVPAPVTRGPRTTTRKRVAHATWTGSAPMARGS